METDSGPYRYRDHCRTRFRCQPFKRLTGEAYCLSRVFVPYNGNDNTRKYATLAIVVTWATLELLSALGHATLPDGFYLLRLFVGILIGRMWGIQFNNIAGMEFSYDDGEDD